MELASLRSGLASVTCGQSCAFSRELRQVALRAGRGRKEGGCADAGAGARGLSTPSSDEKKAPTVAPAWAAADPSSAE